jgi:hypothetical protein
MAKFNMEHYRLATVSPEEIAAYERLWPEACWVRIADEVAFFRRPAGVALAPFMAAMRDLAGLAATATLEAERKKRGLDPADCQLPAGGPEDAIPGMGRHWMVYRSPNGELNSPSRIELRDPRTGRGVAFEGPPIPLETG